jgi:hypothetical protein
VTLRRSEPDVARPASDRLQVVEPVGQDVVVSAAGRADSSPVVAAARRAA